MQKLRIAAVAALALALSACQNALNDDYGPMTGTWRVTITGYQPWAAQPEFVCDVQTTIVIRQEGSDIEGESVESPMACADTRAGTAFTHTKIPGVVRGEVESGRVRIYDAGGYYCFGELDPSRIEGYLESYGGVGSELMGTLRSGVCVLEKISEAGYYGPRA